MIKAILFVLSVVSIYYFVLFIKEKGIKIFEEPIPFIVITVSSSLISLLLYFLFSERPLSIEEIKEEKREEEKKQKKEWESMKETLPLLEITISTNEKIKGKFLEKKEYFEEVETKNKYYKAYIVKIEKI